MQNKQCGYANIISGAITLVPADVSDVVPSVALAAAPGIGLYGGLYVKGRRAWALSLIFIFVFSFFAKAFGISLSGMRQLPPPLVVVSSVTTEDVNPPAEYVGHVEAIQVVDLRARVQGFLEKVNFKEGGFVHAGDVLYVIEQAPYQAKLDACRAQVAQAQAALTCASQHLKRLQEAGAQSVPATDIDDAVAARLQAKATLQQAQADLRLAEINLSYTTIKAPISGRIGKTAYTKGNLVGPGSQPLARIVELDPIRVVYSISENELVTIQAAIRDATRGKKNPVLVPRIRLSNGKIYKSVGYVDFVNNEVDSATGTIAVRAVFDNSDGILLPGQYVTALLKRSKPHILPVVLQTAVQQDRQGSYVLVVGNDNKVIQRRVKAGAVLGMYRAIESGLSKGERVIIQGVQKVRPGQTVKVVDAKQ